MGKKIPYPIRQNHSYKKQKQKQNKTTDLVETQVFMNLPDLNETVLDDLNRTFSLSIFVGRKETIKRTLIFQSYKAGGLKMVDVKSVLAVLEENPHQ